MTDPSPVESQRFLAKILHFDLSQKAEKLTFVLFCFCLLLILRFGDEVNFSAGFPARPVGSLGRGIPSAWLLVLLGPPTRSSSSPLSLGRTWATFRLAFRLSA